MTVDTSKPICSRALSGAVLAYLGDAVFEVCVREFLIFCGIHDIGQLNRLAVSFVKASAQSDAVESILGILDEDELSVFKRGRNSSGISAPKSASSVQYRRATGFEALVAYLYLDKKEDRIKELFSIAYKNRIDEILSEQGGF